MAAGALSWGLAFAISGNIITIGALGGPAGWLAAGLGLLILGGAIVLFTRDTPIEQWLDNNYFGKAWDSNEFNNLNPKETSFRFRYEDEPTRPNFSRQVSAFFSVLSPMRLEEMIVGSRLAETDKYVIITMNPVLVDNDSFVMLTPYDENGVKIGENSPPITFDNHELHVQRTSMLEAGTDWFRPVQHSTNWICEFRIAAPGTGVDSSYGYQLPAGTEYVEVNLIPPDTEFETLDAMQQYAEYVPNIIRGRGAVPSR
ncbi:MAG: hypothetical protein H8E48_00340 [Chloroflexi bacterium]|nr:hypothetical protein [Chloroflexota bacterium]